MILWYFYSTHFFNGLWDIRQEINNWILFNVYLLKPIFYFFIYLLIYLSTKNWAKNWASWWFLDLFKEILWFLYCKKCKQSHDLLVNCEKNSFPRNKTIDGDCYPLLWPFYLTLKSGLPIDVVRKIIIKLWFKRWLWKLRLVEKNLCDIHGIKYLPSKNISTK